MTILLPRLNENIGIVNLLTGKATREFGRLWDLLAARTVITAGAGITVTNGDGSAGNPTIAFSGLANVSNKAQLPLDGTDAMTAPITLKSYTVALLPAVGAGKIAYASNGRKSGEGAGVGTGVMVFSDTTGWRACYNGTTVTA